jgi:hypothetical protein
MSKPRFATPSGQGFRPTSAVPDIRAADAVREVIAWRWPRAAHRAGREACRARSIVFLRQRDVETSLRDPFGAGVSTYVSFGGGVSTYVSFGAGVSTYLSGVETKGFRPTSAICGRRPRGISGGRAYPVGCARGTIGHLRRHRSRHRPSRPTGGRSWHRTATAPPTAFPGRR